MHDSVFGLMFGSMHGSMRGSMHGLMFGSMRGSMHGLMFGSMRGSMHGSMRGSRHGSMRGSKARLKARLNVPPDAEKWDNKLQLDVWLGCTDFWLESLF